MLSFISAIPIIAGHQDFLVIHKNLLASENNVLLNNLMFQAEIYVAFKGGDPEQKMQALLIGEIDPDFTKNKGLPEPSTGEDFKEFKQAVRERLYELFKDFKSRHHEYKKVVMDIRLNP